MKAAPIVQGVGCLLAQPGMAALWPAEPHVRGDVQLGSADGGPLQPGRAGPDGWTEAAADAGLKLCAAMLAQV